jgi:nucleotide-binding universal stress UspA family protein
MFKHILLPTDGGELSMKAVRHGMQLAKQIGAKATALIVRRPLREFVAEGITIPVSEEQQKDYTQQMDKLLDAARAEAKSAGIACEALQVVNDEAWRGIIDTAKSKGCDLIVMSSHGRRGVSAFLLGSETQKVLTHSSVPVLVYR